MPRTVFTNANLLDGLHPTARGATVIIDGDRITSVGNAPVTPAPGDRVVDLNGRTLMPGMVTCHFHSTYHELGTVSAPYGLEEPAPIQALRAAKHLEQAVECGFTGVVSAGAPHDIDAAMVKAIDQGLVRGPRFVPGSRELSTTGHGNDTTIPAWDVRGIGAARICDGPDAFRKAVRDEVKRGARVIKLFVTGGHGTLSPKDRIEMTRAELQAAIDTAHDRDVLIRGHVVNKPAIMMAIDAGIDIIDHGDEIDGECIDAMAAAGTFLAPSIFFPKTFVEQMGPGLGFTDSMRADLEQMCDALPKANAAGVRLVVGDDYGAMGFPHGRYGAELGVYVRDASIPALDVIRWATVNGAQLLGHGDELGTIAEGKLADLVVVDGDPVDDISVLADADRIVAVLKGGEVVKGTPF